MTKSRGGGVFEVLSCNYTAIYRLRFYSNSLTHILSLSNSHNDVASIQKNRDDKSHRVMVALGRCSFRVMTPGYAEVTLTTDFEIFSISQVSQVVHVNFTSVHSVAS